MTHDFKLFQINHAQKRFINKAHKRNQTTVFFTINNKEDMEYLEELGVDIITTDSPDLLKQVLSEN